MTSSNSHAPATSPVHSAVFLPGDTVAGTWGCWTVRVTLGRDGLATGGLVGVQLPNSWYLGPYNGAKGVHSVDGTAPNYVSARCSRPDVEVRCQIAEGSTDPFVITHRPGLDGQTGRLVWVAEVEIVAGEVHAGDSIDVLFGDQSQGSPGFRAALHPEGPEQILVTVQNSPMGLAEHLGSEKSAWAEVVPAAPVEVVATLPSIVTASERALLHLAVFDQFANLVTDFEGEVTISCRTGTAQTPGSSRFTSEGGGVHQVEVRAVSGIVRLEVDVKDLGTWLSNPMEVADPSSPRLYWGDLHSHAADSADALGASPFEYARGAASLDFFGLSEHAEGWAPETWPRVRDRINQHDDPDHFVTILAYEAAFGPPWGHHNVYFRGDDGPLVANDTGTLPDLWKALAAGSAITVPHHTGIQWRTPQELVAPGLVPNPDWSFHDRELRRLVEIYSLHGLSESFDPKHPLAYDHQDHTWARSVDGPHYAWDAWAGGLELGVIASSDDHAAQPGRVEGGLAAVWSHKLDRASIFDSLYHRRTYGTTGSRMILRLQVNGVAMGQVAPLVSPAHVEIDVHGTGPVRLVELVVQDHEQGLTDVVVRWEAVGYDFTTTWMHSDPPRRGLYYLRVREEESRRGRPVMGWSSPIWFGHEAHYP